MMKNFKALSKQLLGAHYEQIRKSLFVCVILYFALYTAEIRFAISPFILYLTATSFTAGVMWQALCSSRNTEAMAGFLMLPFDSKHLTFAYTLVFSTYIILTKALPIMMIFFVILIDLGLALLYLSSVSAYLFYRPLSAKRVVQHSSKQGSVFTYLLRYLFTNKNYLINTLGLWVIACFLPFLLGELEGLNAMPLGLAILCLNTPICIMLSCDPDLEQAIRVLPGQAARFYRRYCLFMFFIHLTASSIYLCSWQLQYSGIGRVDLVMAILFAFQSAASLCYWNGCTRSVNGKWKAICGATPESILCLY